MRDMTAHSHFTDELKCALCETVPARPIWIDDTWLAAVCEEHDKFWWWDSAIGRVRREAIRRAEL